MDETSVTDHTNTNMSSSTSPNDYGIGTTTNASVLVFLQPRFIPYVMWLILMSVIGTLGNLLIILSLVINKKLRVLSNIFVINLAFADIFVTTIIDPFSVIAVFNEGNFFYQHDEVCVFAGVFVVTCCACSIWTITAISFERYIHICNPNLYPKIFNRRTAPVIIVCLWIVAFCIAFPYLEGLGWGIYGYFPKGRICTCIFNVNYYYAWYLIGLELILPMIIIPFCYIKIYLLVRGSQRRLSRHSACNSLSRGTNLSRWQDSDMKILKMVISIWAVFMVMWSPYTANVLFDTTASWHELFFMTAVAFCLSNSSINFIIYGIMNDNFREAYVMILRQIFSCFGVLRVSNEKSEIGSTPRVSSTTSPNASRLTPKTEVKSAVWDISSKV